MTARSCHFRDYEGMLVRLHRLISRGVGDSLESIRLREEMEVPEQSLTVDDIRLLNDLSGDLYMLSGTEMPPHDVRTGDDVDIDERFLNSWDSENWGDVLMLLRTHPSNHDPVDLAYLRANAYEHLGLLHAACAFYDEAARLDPTNASFPCLAMEAALDAGDVEDARRRAMGFLNDDHAPPRQVVTAANVLFQSATNPDEIAAIDPEVVISRLKSVLSRESSDVIRFIGLGTLGLLLREQGAIDEGRKAIQEALDAAPSMELMRIPRKYLEKELLTWDVADSGPSQPGSRTVRLAKLLAGRLDTAA